jgi:hypothetical protein
VLLRTDFSAGELSQLAKRAGDADQARRAVFNTLCKYSRRTSPSL